MSSRKSKLHLYADECIPVPCVTFLRSKGIAAIHAFDLDMVEKDDQLHFRKSKSEGRVLLSLDKDFKKFNELTLENHPGVILLSSGNITPAHLNKILEKVLRHITPNSVRESLIKISLDKIVKKKNGITAEQIINPKLLQKH